MDPTIIVVDDEQPIVDMVCEALVDADMAAVGCTRAAEAFWCIRHYRPQLVILDIQMPGVDGIQLLEQLRDDPQTAGLPVIFFTANRHQLEARLPHYRELGAWLLPKPFHIDALFALVREVLNSGHAGGPRSPAQPGATAISSRSL